MPKCLMWWLLLRMQLTPTMLCKMYLHCTVSIDIESWNLHSVDSYLLDAETFISDYFRTVSIWILWSVSNWNNTWYHVMIGTSQAFLFTMWFSSLICPKVPPFPWRLCNSRRRELWMEGGISTISTSRNLIRYLHEIRILKQNILPFPALLF